MTSKQEPDDKESDTSNPEPTPSPPPKLPVPVIRPARTPKPTTADSIDLAKSASFTTSSPADQGTTEAESTGRPGADHRKLIRPVRKEGLRMQPDLVGLQPVQGTHPGDRYVRVVRQQSEDFEKVSSGHLVATEDTVEPEGIFGHVKRVAIGAPMTTASAAHERLANWKALAVLSSDALSSVAYATEEILRMLLISAGVAALSRSLPIGAAIVALLFIVGISYRQTIKAYPKGGGAYIVAKDNLGELPALTAGAALLTDYVLTVSVSIAASVAAIVSAVPEANDHRVIIGLIFIAIVTVLNLRGIRESGSIFAVPTYLFIFGIAVMLLIGIARNAADGFPVQEPPVGAEELAGFGALTFFVTLKAFSSGCSALTGVEAISDGVPAFKVPEWVNARKTLTVMILLLATMFSGITFLAHQYGAYAMEGTASNYQTVVSQIAEEAFGGRNFPYYYIQAATMLILVLAANTAYSDFPRLSYFLARDGYMPRQFTFRGDRLAYSTGIVTLGLMAGLVLALFGGETERLIPLYAVGVFTSFTISQSGMVVHWLKDRTEGWRLSILINGVGAIATGVVAVVVILTKFTHGAWIICLLIPLLVLAMKSIHGHYARAAEELATAVANLDEGEINHTIIVPISNLNRVARQTLQYASSISDNVTAVHVTDDEESIEQMKRDWAELDTTVPLVIIESPYRQLVGPLMRYIDEIDAQRPDDVVTVVLPEYVASRWWEHLLHNQTALRLKAALLFRPNTVVISVPYHLQGHRKSSKKKSQQRGNGGPDSD